MTDLEYILEAIFFSASKPIILKKLQKGLPEFTVLEIESALRRLREAYAAPDRAVEIVEVSAGYQLRTKPEHKEWVKRFVKEKDVGLTKAVLETLAVIAYKQPVTAPEVMAIRGVQGASVLKTLLDRKLIAAAGRKNVIGKPILYETTREFLIQFGLKDLSELPSLKEFEEIKRMAFADAEQPQLLPGMEEPVQVPDLPSQES